ncbi:hypothetical protein B0H15DRAFT_513011 [Mycena belliarum]|uniref:Uncharacterized protein n=1 Tax=Mycena belliarum TaxID=1033014 RepID=A0AAD6UH75_9AGAR|nr:hypothetical protein B0H15DRAFT_513011 [Mycena belliae]
MNRLVRLVARQPTLFATRRAPLLSPRLRRYASQKPTPESLYAEYLNSRRPPVDLHEPGAKNYPPPEPVTFEMFQEILAQSPLDVEWDGEGENEAADTDLDLDKKYDSMLEALQEMESSDRALTALDQMDTSDPGFIDALGTLSPQELEKMAGRVLDLMAPPIDDPVFEERLENIGGEVRPAREVAWRVAQIVQSTTDKAKLERIENALATYNGPLSVLNAHVEWYLSNPGEIEAEERHYNNKLEMQADMSGSS